MPPFAYKVTTGVVARLPRGFVALRGGREWQTAAPMVAARIDSPHTECLGYSFWWSGACVYVCDDHVGRLNTNPYLCGTDSRQSLDIGVFCVSKGSVLVFG